MKMIFIFIDGFGMGEDNKAVNPIIAANTPTLERVFRQFTVIPTDTTLGVKGLPQSATGQTAIFTGVNAASLLGKHLSGQPTESLKRVIRRNNLFMALLRRGLRVTNSNVYRQEYLDKMLDAIDRRYRPSVSSVMTMAAGIPFRKVEDYNKGLGIYHDITGQILRDSGYDVELTTPKDAAERLYRVSRDYDFTMYEHFLTDIIGHKMDMGMAVAEIELLDTFLGHLLEQVDPDEDIVWITSDHGNIEDVSVKTHTYNKVPTMVIGNVPEGVQLNITTLLDIMPAVERVFDAQAKVSMRKKNGESDEEENGTAGTGR